MVRHVIIIFPGPSSLSLGWETVHDVTSPQRKGFHLSIYLLRISMDFSYVDLVPSCIFLLISEMSHQPVSAAAAAASTAQKKNKNDTTTSS